MTEDLEITRYEALDIAERVLEAVKARTKDYERERALIIALSTLNIHGVVWASEESDKPLVKTKMAK